MRGGNPVTVDGEPTGASLPARARLFLTLLFFASGAVGLAYEVAWTRGLLRLLGSTAVGSALVLGAFVGGLGLGARWCGRRVEASSRPLALYGALEVGAAVWALLVLPLAGWLEGPYVALATPLPDVLRWVLRGLIAALLVVPGAMLLGGTLPAIESAWTRGVPGTGRALAWLYGVNTLGAVAGALLCGFWLIEALGVWGALLAAVGLGAAVGLLALAVGRSPRVAPAGPAPDGPGRVPRGALAGAFLCGLLGLGLEIAGFRVLVFFVEGFTVCFAAMLATWIAGLGLGSLLLGPWLVRLARPSRALALLLGATGVLGFGLTRVWLPDLDAWLLSVKAWAFEDARVEADLLAGQRWVALAGSLALLFLPALLLGAAFPVCVRWARADGAPPAVALGRVYLWNSLGTLAAPLLVTLLLVPWKGVLASWVLVGAAAACASIAFARPGRWFVPVAAALLFGVLLLGPEVTGGLAADPLHALRGDQDGDLLRHSHVLRRHADRRLLALETDEVTTASVVETGEGERILYTDDFAAAATGRHYRYMRLLGHLPLLLAKEQAHVLVIAFGTGTTAGAAAAHPGVKRLEVAEVSRAVLDLAPWFRDANRGVLDDARTRVLVNDGRDALLLHEPDLDVITLEPLMPYSPAGLPFYTREFYELARDRLRDGGVVCQWVPVHAMPAAMFAALVRTFFEVFPEGDLWFFEQSVALTGGRGADRGDLADARARAVARDLAEAGYPGDSGGSLLLRSAHVAGAATVRRAPAPEEGRASRAVTDLDPWPEFHATPRGVRTSYLLETLVFLTTLADVEHAREPGVAALKARVADAAADQARSHLERLAHLEEAARLYASALEGLPGEAALLWRRARAARAAAALRVADVHAKAQAARARGSVQDALALENAAAAYALGALALPDGDPVAGQRGAAARTHALALLRLGRCGAARRTLAEAASALQGTAEAETLARWLADLAVREGGGAPAVLPSGLPPCRAEGLAHGPVRAAFQGWEAAVRHKAPAGGVRAAALGLVDAVVTEGAEPEVLAALEALTFVGNPTAYVRVAALRARLGDPSELLDLLRYGDPAQVSAALDEVGAARSMRSLPDDLLAALRADATASVREALASALGSAPGPREKRLLVDLLADPDRGVRAAAAAALVPHDAEDMKDYDPDGTRASWQKVQERLRAAR